MKKSNFTTKKLSMVLALAVTGQLLISAPAQAAKSTPPKDPAFLEMALKNLGIDVTLKQAQAVVKSIYEWCFGEEEGGKKYAEFVASCTSCQQNQVPEPLTIFGVGATLASLPAFKKYYNKKNNQEEIG